MWGKYRTIQNTKSNTSSILHLCHFNQDIYPLSNSVYSAVKWEEEEKKKNNDAQNKDVMSKQW